MGILRCILDLVGSLWFGCWRSLDSCDGLAHFVHAVTPVCPIRGRSLRANTCLSTGNGTAASPNRCVCSCRKAHLSGGKHSTVTRARFGRHRLIHIGRAKRACLALAPIRKLGLATGCSVGGVSCHHGICRGPCINSNATKPNHLGRVSAQALARAFGRLVACDGSVKGRGFSILLKRRGCSCGCRCLCNVGARRAISNVCRFNGFMGVDSLDSCAGACGGRNCFNHVGCSCTRGCCTSLSCHRSNSSHFTGRGQ